MPGLATPNASLLPAWSDDAQDKPIRTKEEVQAPALKDRNGARVVTTPGDEFPALRRRGAAPVGAKR